MLRRLAIALAVAAAGALPEPPFVCDNTQCRVEPRNASAAPICAAGYYTCASCCDQDADCNCDGHGGDGQGYCEPAEHRCLRDLHNGAGLVGQRWIDSCPGATALALLGLQMQI